MRHLLLAVAFLAVATGGRAEVLRVEPEIRETEGGDRVVLRWDGVPRAAVEQEVLVSLDGGRRWIEVRRLEITVRQFELRLPHGVGADLLFAVRAGGHQGELEEAVTAPVRQQIRLGARVPVLLPSSLGRREDRRTDGSSGGRGLPPGLEPPHEDRSERLRTSAEAAWRQLPAGATGPRLDLAPPVPRGGAAPRDIPLRT